MNTERQRVAELMGGDDMPITPDEIEAIANATAQKVWFWLIQDSVTGTARGAAFHLRQAREDALTAATRPLPGGATPEQIADAVIDEIAS
jgi:hypothetical protein